MNTSSLGKCKDCKCDPCTCANQHSGYGTSDLLSFGKHGFWQSNIAPIIIILALIIGAYLAGRQSALGGYGKLDKGDMANRANIMQMSSTDTSNMDAMSEHCKMMPEMEGCRNNNISSSGNTSNDMGMMNMNDMSKMLQGKTGDDLNRSFLEGMIPHHQAAVDMAKFMAGSNKPELVKLGGEIIITQTKEIEQMTRWMKEWGYESGSTNSGNIHGTMMMR